LSDSYYPITLDLDAEFLKDEVKKLGYEGTYEQIEAFADIIQEEANLFTWNYAERIIISALWHGRTDRLALGQDVRGPAPKKIKK